MSLHSPTRSKVLRKNRSFCKKSAPAPDGFSALYPTRAVLPRFIQQNVEIVLHYQKTKVRAVVPLYVETVYLQQIFHEAIYKFEASIQPQKAIRQTARVIGFQSVDGDTLLDYRITIGKGILDRTVDFRCLFYQGHRKTPPIQKYRIIKCLAIGGFSKVYLVRSHYDGKFYALKAISKTFIKQSGKENVITNQKHICSKLSHPFIVDLKHCFESANFLCFVFEYCPGGELFYYLKSVRRISEEKAKFYFLEILYGLQYLHQQGIIYRDLKPENLLINVDGHLKIVDFGLSKDNMADGGLTYSFCGSAEYMPPEMILRAGHSFGVDYYTLGALLYELVTGLPPFYSQEEGKLKEAILHSEITFPQSLQLSEDLKMLLRGLLCKNQKLRLGSLKGIKQILFHPWLGKVSTEQVLGKCLTPPYVPDVNEFNFDENELGDDEEEFTRNLICDSRTTLQPGQHMFEGFQFQSQLNLRGQQLDLLKQLSRQEFYLQHKSLPKHSSKSLLRISSSMKALNAKSNYILNREFSSPYLQGLFKNERHSLPNQDRSLDTSSKVLARPKPQRRMFPKYINAYVSQYEKPCVKKRNFRKIL